MWKKYFPDMLTLVLVTGMVALAEVIGDREIIFPEITALAVGYMVSEKRSWMVNGLRMLLLITGCAIAGVLIVRSMGLTPLAEIVVAFALAQILFMVSGTTFAPFISAIVLPVMLRTTSWIYPIAAFVLTLCVILGRALLVKVGVKKEEKYNPVKTNVKECAFDSALRVACVLILGVAAFAVDWKYMIAPPLLVAFTEFSRKGNKARTIPVKVVAVITGCGLVGVASRMLLHEELGLPMAAAAFVATFGMLVIMRKNQLFIPPAGAITILAMLIPESALLSFPLQILLGSAAVMTISRALFMGRQEEKVVTQEREIVER
ncbi:hypothetical protein SAMN02910358_02485 [Lachnospiraceae bacterium XBB1006]|nr:hypothetical protein SAMN02910358_02485 [Lachnospiraceae bacterium XBB1006]